MNIFRRWGTLGLSALLIGSILSTVALASGAAAPAAAQSAEAFAGSANAEGLKLSLFGTNVTIGATSAEADTTPQAVASGSGLALLTATQSSATANSTTPSASEGPKCGLNLQLTSIAGLALACSTSSGSIADSAPTAASSAKIGEIDVGLLNTVLQLLQPILNALEPVANQIVGNVLTTVTNALNGLGLAALGTTVTNLLGNLGVSTTQPVSSLITALEKATNLATITVGPSASSVTTSSGTVVATSSAQGAVIDVLPGITVTGKPLLEITVGQASTTSTYNRGTGKSNATFSPAIVSINLLGDNIPIGLGAPVNLFPGTALASSISLGAGSTKSLANGGVSAQADGVAINLLTGLNGGISLALADASSSVGGTPAVAAVTTTSTTSTTVAVAATSLTTKPPVLATTGADEAPLLPIGFALLLAGYLARRRWLVGRRQTDTTR